MFVGNKFRRITAMIMIIVMVVTSGGIHSFSSTFANAINEMKESSKDLSHKYYDEMMEEKAEKESQEVIEDEKTEEVEDNSQEKTLGENENSENESSESDEGEDDKSESDEEPEEDDRTKESDEEPEEDESTKESDKEPGEEPEEDEPKEAAVDEISEDGSSAEESESTEESETEVETTPAFDEENNIASDSEADTDTINDEEDNTSTTNEEEHIKTATYSEIFTVATGSEADESGARVARPYEASASEADEVGEATASEIASPSDILLFKDLVEATASEMDKELGGKSDFYVFGYTMKVPTYIVFGDVGYDTEERQTDQGYIGMYLGIDQGKDGKGDDAESEYVSSYSHRYYGGSAPHYISYAWNNESHLSSKAYRAGMMPPEYYAPVSWYVQSTADVGHFEVRTKDEKGINEVHESVQFEKLTPDEFRAFWDFLYNGKKDLTWKGRNVFYVRPYLHGVDCWRSGNDINSDLIGKYYEDVKKGLYERINKADIANQYNYQYNDFLTKNQNIRGYIIDEDQGAGNYKLKLVEGVKFNNEWEMKEVDDAVTAWSIQDIDDEITVGTAQSEWYDWRLRFKTSYYGIHIGQAKTNIDTHVHWRNGNWKYDPGKYSGTNNLAALSDDSTLEFTIPTSTKNVNYTDGSGNKYKLVGWTLEPHKYELRKNYFDGNGHDIRFVSKDLNENLKDNFVTNLIWKPGETVNYKIPTGTAWPITFGPFYRQKFIGDGYKLVDGYRWGVGDKGANGVFYDDYMKKEVNGDYPNAWWSMITKAQRGNNTYNDFTDNPVHYNVLFLSPVLKKEVSKTATLHANGGTWTDTKKGEDKSITYNNFDSKSLPTNITRTGYTFKHWNTQADGNGTSYTSLGSSAIDNNVTELYAIWTANTYKFKYFYNKVNGSDGNEYTGGTEGSEFDGTYGKKIKMPEAKDYALEGFTLLGFSDSASDTTGKFKPATEYTVNTTNFTSVLAGGTNCIYPIYQEKSYPIKFNAGSVAKKNVSDGKEKSNTNSSKQYSILYYTTYNFSDTDVALTGFNLQGYNTSDQQSTVQLKLGTDLKGKDIAKTFSLSETDEKDFYGVWKEKEYKIEFKGGKVKGSDNVEYTSAASVAAKAYKYYSKVKGPNTFTIDGFTAKGFAKSSSTKSLVKPGQETAITAIYKELDEQNTTTLYTIWEEKQVKIVFNNGRKQASDKDWKTDDKNKVEKSYPYKTKVEVPQDFAMEGFNFKGFNTADEKDAVTLDMSKNNKETAGWYVSTYGITENTINFYGVWEEKKYSLKIEAGSKEVSGKTYIGTGSIAAKEYGYFSNITMPAGPTLRGFKLLGYSKDDQASEQKYKVGALVDIKDLIKYIPMEEKTSENTEDNTLYGVWEITSATLKFDADLGVFLSNKKRQKEITVSVTGKPLGEYTGYEEPFPEDGYEFTYWLDADGNKYTSDTVVVGDIELTAQYKFGTTEETNNKRYAISIKNDATKGTYAGPDSFDVKLGSDIIASMSEAGVIDPVAATGYTFLGWSWTEDEADIVKTGDVYADINLKTLTAVYSEDKINIRLSAGAGEFTGGLKAKTIISTESKALNEYDKYEEPTLLNHTFSKWVNESGVEVASTSIMTSDITLFAQYTNGDGNVVEDSTVYTITIKHNSDKGTYTGATTFGLKVGSNILASMSEAGVTNPIATPGYIFLGWSWSDSADDLIKIGDLYTDSTLDSVTAIYAIKEEDVIKVVLSAGEGEFVGGGKVKTIVSGSIAALNAFTGYEVPTRENYEFVRWLDATGVEVAPTTVINNDTTLFASYKIKGDSLEDGNYTVIIANESTNGKMKVGGVEKDFVKISMRLGDEVFATLASYSITAEANTGYVFAGWSWTGDIDNVIKAGDKYTDSKDAKLVAVWKNLLEYTVILRANTGVFKSDGSRRLKFVIDNTISTMALQNIPGYERPVKENATFSKWVVADTRATFSETTFVASDLILDAIYTDNTTGEPIGEGNTADGGENAAYTVMIKNEVSKGTMSNAERRTIGGKEYDVAFVDFKIGDKILDKINDKGLTIESSVKNIFEGWSKTEGEEGLISDSATYSDKDLTDIYAVYYDVLSLKITLNANTGLFFDSKERKRVLTANIKTALKDFAGYDEPIKSDGYTFDHWEDSLENIYPKTYEFNENKTIELFAIYKDNKGNTVGKNGSQDDGFRASYTVLADYDPQKSSISNTKFEVKKNASVMQAMIDYNVYEPTEQATGWWHKGWSFENNLATLIDGATQYSDTTKTSIYAQYVAVDKWTLVLDANTGLFETNERIMSLENEKQVAINKFPGYHKPHKSNGFTFDRWESATGKIYNETTKIDDPLLVLYAIYKDKDKNDVGKDDTRHKGSKATYTIKLLSDARGTIEGKDEFEIREGDFILATMSYAGIKDPKPTDGNFFVGWTWTNTGTEVDYENAVTADNIYKGPDYSAYNGGAVLYALYSNELLDVTLKANTGLFSDDTREKKLQVPKYQLLRAADGYEIPVKGGSTFDSWERENGASIMDLQKFKVLEPMTLKAIYRDKDGNEDGREKDGKHDGGENATYTVRVNNDDSKGQYDGAEYFDIKKGEVVYTTMKAAGVKEATPSTGYAFKGWKLGEDLISATTTYEDPNNTVLNLEYSTQTTLVTFDASFGAFADGSRVKRYTLARGRILNTIDGYEEPTKKKWTFNRWADTKGATVASSSIVPDDAATYELKAMYLNRDGVEVSEDAHSHLVCGANDEIASHATNVIAPHTTKVAYLPIVSAEEFYKYINDELAKPELERKDIRMYLEEDIELDSDIAIGNNMNLYLCLNGYTLRSKKLDNRANEIGNIYITNCKENEVSIIEDAEGSDTNKPLFGGNSIHMLSARGKINLSVAGRVVDVVSTASAVSKDIEFMNVSIKGNDDVLVDKFVSALGNSRVRLVDVDINGVSVTNTLIGTYEGANFYVGGRVSLEDNYTNRAIVETNDAFNIAANSALIASSNVIEKKVNGDTAILFIGGIDNKVYGDLKVSNNKLTLSDDYKKLVKVKPVVVDDTTSEDSDDNNDDSLEMNKLLGMYDEEVSPAGEVGYSSAVTFTKDNIGFVVGNSTIEIYDNESVASYSDVRAGYMYQLRAKNNTKTALIQQNSGTALSQDSVIGIAFASEDGEGFLTDSRKISQDVFKNNTFGKEEKLLNIKETDGNMELLRKRYYLEYDEGTPTTNETKRVIQSYLSDGATISEATRVRSKAIKAGHDLKLLGNDVYYTKGFDLSTYSIIDKNKKSIGLYDPKSTMSYIGDIFRDGSDIEDGDVFKAVANWDERELKSEARNLVITKEKYDELLEQAAEAAVIAEASASDIAQEEVVEENEPVYTVHYHLNGGKIAGHEVVEGTDYYEVTGLSKKTQYTLLMDVVKVATESGVPRSYDFMGWVFENEDNDYTYSDDMSYVTVVDPEYLADGEDVVNVYAVYLPSTFKITYHLDGGVLDGFEGDTIEDTITRTLDYTLLSGPTKEDYYFIKWKIVDGDSTYSTDVISAESLKNDIDAYAQYESALYSVTYKLNGGVIKGITEEGDETYVDNKANMLRDYYLYTDVTKPEHRFVEWEAVKNGATVDVIKAGDDDQSKREVEAIFEPTTWDIVYDTDGGTIEGTDGGNIIDKQEVGKEYKLFTNVTKEGWDFAYWYDETTKEKVEVIPSPKGGCTYRVKAAYVLTSYDLTLHLDDETTEELKYISNKAEFVLPTDRTLENKEFVRWYYKNENGDVLKIAEIPKGNPENITDVYAEFDDLMTQKIVYHLGAGQSMKIGDVEAYDPGSTEDSKTVTVMKNRRENTGLVTDVKRDGWVFVGWREGRQLYDGWETLITEEGMDLSDSFSTFAPGITKAFEDVYGNEESDKYVGDIKNSEYNYYPHFIKTENLPGDGTVRVKFHVVKGEGTIYGATKTSVNTGGYSSETVYVKNVVPIMDLSLDELTSIGLKWNLVGVYETKAEALEDYDSRSKADSKRISVETLKENLYTDLDLYVTFEQNKNVRNITYFLDDGTLDGIILNSSNTYSKEYFVEPGVDVKGYYDVVGGAKKEGYEFGGWYTSIWGNGTKVTDVSQFEGKNLFAYWKSKNYKVTYNLHGGKISGIVGDTYTKTYSRLSDAVLETDVTMDNYKFDGWYTQPDGKGQKYTVIPKSDSEVEDLTLHAHYIYAKYKVKYMLNGGSLVGKTLAASGSYIVTYDNREVVQLPTKKDIINEGAEFFRWEDKNGNAYQRIEEGNTEDLVLYAKYSTETIDIIFNIGDKGKAKGKIAKDGKFKETYNLASDMVLPTELSWSDTKKNAKTGKTYEEYYFDGWYKTKNYTGKPITVIPAGNPEKIEQLYAKWVNGTYRIIYHMNHGYISGLSKNEFIDESYEGTVKYEEYELPTDVTRASSEFLGWYDKPQMTGTPITKLTKNPKQLVDGDVVHVYAKWKTSKYYVQYVVRQKDYADTSMYYGTYKNTVSVDNKYPYVLQNETSNTSLVGALGATYGFDGWYEDSEFNGNEIVSVDANTTEDKTIYAKLVKLSNLDEEALAAFNARAEERTKKREDAEAKRKKAIDDASKEQGTKTKEQLKKSNNFLYLLVDDIMNEDKKAAQDAIDKELNSSGGMNLGLLLGALVKSIGEALLGDGPEDPTPAPAASPSEIVVNLADLLAYDTISEKNLGISAPKGTHLDSIIVTYIKDPFNSLVSDYTFVGSILTVGSDFSEIASVYPDHTLGVRAIFLDDKINEKPVTPRRPYYGGGDNGGKGGGGVGGGRMPGSDNAIIVNPYGYDGRGSDNGATRAVNLKLHVNAKLNRIATPSYGNYKVIDLAKGASGLVGFSNETWEYFPASNAFKLFASAPNGDRYYLTNGWHKRQGNSKDLWYRFDSDGLMQRGFVEEGGKIYYLNNALSELAYMVTGFKDFEGTGYTGYFKNDGSLAIIFPTAQRLAYETKLAALPDIPIIDRTIYEKCRQFDIESTRIVKSVKTYGQSVMGNFVGYWYYLASGIRKLRLETINTELQIARFANNGWMNIYDTDGKLHSYRFDNMANLYANTITPEGYIVSAEGKLSDRDILLDFATIDATKDKNYVLALTTLNTLPTYTRKLQSHLVAVDGMPIPTSPATDIWTVMDFQGGMPVMTNAVYGGTSLQPPAQPAVSAQPLQFLSTMIGDTANAFSTSEIKNAVPTLGSVGVINPVNIVKMTKVLSNVDYVKGIKTVAELAADRKISSVYGFCMDVYNTVMGLLAA